VLERLDLERLHPGSGLGGLEPRLEQLESWTWALGCSSRREALEVAARAAPGSPALRTPPMVMVQTIRFLPVRSLSLSVPINPPDIPDDLGRAFTFGHWVVTFGHWVVTPSDNPGTWGGQVP
jgi:hypothetical protein